MDRVVATLLFKFQTCITKMHLPLHHSPDSNHQLGLTRLRDKVKAHVSERPQLITSFRVWLCTTWHTHWLVLIKALFLAVPPPAPFAFNSGCVSWLAAPPLLDYGKHQLLLPYSPTHIPSAMLPPALFYRTYNCECITCLFSVFPHRKFHQSLNVYGFATATYVAWHHVAST